MISRRSLQKVKCVMIQIQQIVSIKPHAFLMHTRILPKTAEVNRFHWKLNWAERALSSINFVFQSVDTCTWRMHVLVVQFSPSWYTEQQKKHTTWLKDIPTNWASISMKISGMLVPRSFWIVTPSRNVVDFTPCMNNVLILFFSPTSHT